MPINFTTRLYLAMRRNPSTVAELPSGLSAIGWGGLAALNALVFPGVLIWLIPLVFCVVGTFQTWATLAKDQQISRFFACITMAFFWLFLVFSALRVLGHEAFTAVYAGMAFANVYSSAELVASYAQTRYAKGEWLPLPLLALCVDRRRNG